MVSSFRVRRCKRLCPIIAAMAAWCVLSDSIRAQEAGANRGASATGGTAVRSAAWVRLENAIGPGGAAASAGARAKWELCRLLPGRAEQAAWLRRPEGLGKALSADTSVDAKRAADLALAVDVRLPYLEGGAGGGSRYEFTRSLIASCQDADRLVAMRGALENRKTGSKSAWEAMAEAVDPAGQLEWFARGLLQPDAVRHLFLQQRDDADELRVLRWSMRRIAGAARADADQSVQQRLDQFKDRNNFARLAAKLKAAAPAGGRNVTADAFDVADGVIRLGLLIDPRPASGRRWDELANGLAAAGHQRLAWLAYELDKAGYAARGAAYPTDLSKKQEACGAWLGRVSGQQQPMLAATALNRFAAARGRRRQSEQDFIAALKAGRGEDAFRAMQRAKLADLEGVVGEMPAPMGEAELRLRLMTGRNRQESPLDKVNIHVFVELLRVEDAGGQSKWHAWVLHNFAHDASPADFKQSLHENMDLAALLRDVSNALRPPQANAPVRVIVAPDMRFGLPDWSGLSFMGRAQSSFFDGTPVTEGFLQYLVHVPTAAFLAHSLKSDGLNREAWLPATGRLGGGGLEVGGSVHRLVLFHEMTGIKDLKASKYVCYAMADTVALKDTDLGLLREAVASDSTRLVKEKLEALERLKAQPLVVMTGPAGK